MIPPDFIDELLARTDIVEVVGQRVSLKKQGKDFTGLCPFHNEKSPSFSVSPDKQFYYCFGCQASGSALKFIMEFDRLDFVAAVESLAARAGMEVPRDGPIEAPERVERRKSIHQVLEQAADWYKEQLRQHPGRERAIAYLKQRGLSGEIARDFGLGFAPPGWNNLHSVLAKTNHERELLIESGMLIVNDDGDKEYDRFRDRIMFPIRDNRGRVIAFGGRVIGDDKPKYLNSPETPVFHKGRELYGLYEARKRSRRLEQLMVVEGYMDVVALAQHGIGYAVATLGTATSDEHIDRIFRLVPNLVFCFDGDTAGQNAAWKALQATLPKLSDGRSARFLFLPDGEDPDSLVRTEGKDKFEARIAAAPHLPEVFFEHLQQDLDVTSLDGKASLSKLAMPLIAQIPEGVFKRLMLQQLSSVTGLDVEQLQQAYQPPPVRTREFTREMPPEPPPPDWDIPPEEAYEAPSREPRSELAGAAISALLRSPELAASFDDSVYDQLAEARDCGLLIRMIRTISEKDIRSPAVLLAEFQQTSEFEYLRRLAEQEPLLAISDLPEEYAGIIGKLVKRMESESIQALRSAILAKPPASWTDEERDLLRSLTGASARK